MIHPRHMLHDTLKTQASWHQTHASWHTQDPGFITHLRSRLHDTPKTQASWHSQDPGFMTHLRRTFHWPRLHDTPMTHASWTQASWYTQDSPVRVLTTLVKYRGNKKPWASPGQRTTLFCDLYSLRPSATQGGQHWHTGNTYVLMYR